LMLTPFGRRESSPPSHRAARTGAARLEAAPFAGSIRRRRPASGRGGSVRSSSSSSARPALRERGQRAVDGSATRARSRASRALLLDRPLRTVHGDQLDAVVASRVVRRRDDHAGAETRAIAQQMRDRRGGQDTGPHHLAAGRCERAPQPCGQVGGRGARVARK
jgi:hypothetical protein